MAPTYDPPSNADVQRMTNQSAVEALETDGTAPGAEDLTWNAQSDAINPKQTANLC
jgi:hypothetical protein